MIDKAKYIAQLLLERQNKTLAENRKNELDSYLENDISLNNLSDKLEDVDFVQQNLKKYASIEIPDVNELKRKADLEKKSNFKVSKLRSLFWYAAASILVVLTAGLLYYSNLNPVNHHDLVNEEIVAGSNKATLKLSDGSAYVLNDNQQGVLIEKNTVKYASGNAIIQSTNPNLLATLEVPRGGQYHIKLSDGTHVWLNSDSKLHYPLEFSTSSRTVTIEGEAYFEVAHHPQKPFVVKFMDNEIKVLGTVFNVSAYISDKNYTQTTLLSGSVSLKTSTEEVTLKPNQQAVTSLNSLNVKKVDAERFVLWKEGVIVLEKQNIQAIIPQLERWYDVTFDLDGIPTTSPTLSGEIPRNIPLKAVLEVLKEQLKLKFEIKGRRVMIKN